MQKSKFKMTMQNEKFSSFYHFDCYRLESPEEILQLGFEEIIKNPKNIVAIEWPERISSLLPKDVVRVNFIHRNSTEREIEVGVQ